MSDTDREARVRRKAYSLWEAAGKPEGEHERFWHEAERKVDEGTDEDELEEGLEESFPGSDAPASVMRHEH